MKVDTIAVVGSGLMGRGIAYAAVAGGYRTVLHDVSPEALERARQQVRAELDEGRARGKTAAGDADAAYERLRPEPDLDRAVAGAGFVIEAVPEQIELKLRIFARLEEACLSVLEFLHRTLGDKYRPAPLLVWHVKAGRLGKKVGRGVYEYGRQD